MMNATASTLNFVSFPTIAMAPRPAGSGPLLRYRGAAYRAGAWADAIPSTGQAMVYRGVSYRRSIPAMAWTAAPGQCRYRGVAH